MAPFDRNHWHGPTEIARIIPSGSSVYATHVAFTFYDDLQQVADFMTNEESMSEKSKLELEKGKNTRDRKEMIIAKLIMKN